MHLRISITLLKMSEERKWHEVPNFCRLLAQDLCHHIGVHVWCSPVCISQTMLEVPLLQKTNEANPCHKLP
jgi:hypothetical protein